MLVHSNGSAAVWDELWLQAKTMQANRATQLEETRFLAHAGGNAWLLVRIITQVRENADGCAKKPLPTTRAASLIHSEQLRPSKFEGTGRGAGEK
jgi:hypothetical protein